MDNNYSKRCIFLDRDGVLNEDHVSYSYRLDHFTILPGVPEALYDLKKKGFLLIVVTNQSGISQKIYSQLEMENCHAYFQEKCNNSIDHFYFSPYHPSVTASLARKPGTLMFEKAIAKFRINATQSWMIGDRERDMIPAKSLGMKTIIVGSDSTAYADFALQDMKEAAKFILSSV